MATTITREFCPGDRYRYDFGPCSIARGWAQIDTDQDAHYYGMWANPSERKVFAYIEGDTVLTECETDEEFVANLRDIEAFETAQGRRPARIDPGLGPDIRAAFEALGLADMLH